MRDGDGSIAPVLAAANTKLGGGDGRSAFADESQV
jgi:hypothetical protein